MDIQPCEKPSPDTASTGDKAPGVESPGTTTEHLANSQALDEDKADIRGKTESQKATSKENSSNSHDTRNLNTVNPSFNDDTKQLENAFHTEDEIDVRLSLPPAPENHDPEPVEELKETKKRDSLMKRLSAFAGSPTKTVNSTERPNRHSISGFRDFRRFSRSNSISAHSGYQRSSGSHSLFSKYIKSPSEGSASLDFDFSDCNDSGPGLAPEDDNDDEENEIVLVKKKVEHVREITDTEIELCNFDDPTVAQRPNDPRLWHAKNLKCSNCVGACPVCDDACCVYETGRRAMNNTAAPFTATHGERLVAAIDGLGSHVKDMGTFAMCTLGGGCGRYVCPGCCGICPNEICRDVQCSVCVMFVFHRSCLGSLEIGADLTVKDCKDDPWGPCDWHD